MKSIVAQEIERMGAAVPFAFEVTFADGTTYRNRDEPARFAMRFRNRAAEWSTAAFGHVGMIEKYIDGDIDVDGDLNAAFEAGLNGGVSAGAMVNQRNRWHEFRRSNATWEQARENARAHYGLGADFYGLWLDEPYMMYTCGYWPEGTSGLEQAQINKMEHVCRKVRLAPGESVVDVGFGFGGFMFYALERHGVSVTGINNTPEQVEFVDDEIRRRGLQDRLRCIDTDFRDVSSGPYDKVVSIGVLEHAGRDQLEEVVRAHAELLKPGGLGMLHFIGHVGRRDTEFFIREHVFPGGWIPSLADVIVAMEDSGLEIVDIENLRRHYALTLDEWAKRFDRNWDPIHALDPAKFNERFRRTWRTYLVSCAEMFRSPIERTHLFQIVFSKGNISNRSYPMSRRFLYPQ